MSFLPSAWGDLVRGIIQGGRVQYFSMWEWMGKYRDSSQRCPPTCCQQRDVIQSITCIALRFVNLVFWLIAFLLSQASILRTVSQIKGHISRRSSLPLLIWMLAKYSVNYIFNLMRKLHTPEVYMTSFMTIS